MAFKLPALTGLPKFGKKSCLAVDIGASAVKVCRLTGGGGKYKVDVWDSLPMPAGLAGKDFEAKAAELLKALVDKHKFRKQNAIFALPAQSVIIRYLTFQGIPKDRLEGVVRHEAEGHIPFPLDEVSLDWCEARKKDNGFEVLLVAIKRDKLDSMVTIIEDAGLEVLIVDVTTLALFSLYYHGELKDEKEEDISEVFVDIGAGTTDIAFIKNQRVFFTRSVPIAGRSFTEIISKRLGIPEDKAEVLKIKHAEVKAIQADLASLEGEGRTPGGLASPKAPGASMPTAKSPGLAAPKAPGLAGPAAAGGLTPPKAPGLTPPLPGATPSLASRTAGTGPSMAPPAAGGLIPPKAPGLAAPAPAAGGLTPPSAGGLTPPKAPGLAAPLPGATAAGGLKPPAPPTAEKPAAAPAQEIPKKVTEVALPQPPMMKPPAPTQTAPVAPAAPKPPAAPTLKPPALSLPKPPTAAPAPPGAPPPPGLKAPPPPGLGLPGPKPPAPAPPGGPGGKSLGAAKAEDGEVFSLFESEKEDIKVDKDKLTAAVKPIADRLATELRRSFDYFVGQLGGGEIKRVHLSGGGAALKGLAEYLSTQLNVPVTVFDPVGKVTVPSGQSQDNPQAFAAALGMGMRILDGTPLDIDMLPENILAIRRMRSMGKDVKWFGIAAGLLLVLGGLSAYMTVHNTKTLHAKIQSDIQELDPVVTRTRQLEKDQKTVNDLEKSIANLLGSRAMWMAVLSALDRTIPENAAVRSLTMPTKERIDLRIVTNSLAEIPGIGKRFQTPELTKDLFTLVNRPSPREVEGPTGKTFEVDFTLQVNHAAAAKSAPVPGAGGA